MSAQPTQAEVRADLDLPGDGPRGRSLDDLLRAAFEAGTTHGWERSQRGHIGMMVDVPTEAAYLAWRYGLTTIESLDD